jgi:hypothetical protein
MRRLDALYRVPGCPSGARGGKVFPLKHSFSLASRLAFDSALKSGYAVCACLAQLSITFQLRIADWPCCVAPAPTGTITTATARSMPNRFIVTSASDYTVTRSTLLLRFKPK